MNTLSQWAATLPKNPAELTIRSNQGDPTAYTDLAYCYHLGHGVPQDTNLAVQMLRNVTDRHPTQPKYSLACFLLAQIIETVYHNPAAALPWLEKAALANLPAAQLAAANHFANYASITQHEEKAIHWYRQAAKNHVGEAHFVLADFYHRGIVLQKNHQQALLHYRLAEDCDYAQATQRIESFYPQGQETAEKLAARTAVPNVAEALPIPIEGKSGAFTALLAAADQQQCLQNGQISSVFELEELFTTASTHFQNILDSLTEHSLEHRKPIYQKTASYLFAKGLEATILWGGSNQGEINIDIKAQHLVKFTTNLPGILHQKVENSRKIHDIIYQAQQSWIFVEQNAGRYPDTEAELKELIRYAPQLGVSYGLNNQFQELGNPHPRQQN